jgi:hypothetical protein
MITYTSCIPEAEKASEWNDCAVKAFAVAADFPYKKAHALLKAEGREDRQGTYTYQSLRALDLAGFDCEEIEFTNYGKTPISFARNCDASKTYLVTIRGHIFTVKGGKVEDWTEGRKHRILRAWLVTPRLSKNAARKAARYGK